MASCELLKVAEVISDFRILTKFRQYLPDDPKDLLRKALFRARKAAQLNLQNQNATQASYAYNEKDIKKRVKTEKDRVIETLKQVGYL